MREQIYVSLVGETWTMASGDYDDAITNVLDVFAATVRNHPNPCTNPRDSDYGVIESFKESLLKEIEG